MEFKILIVDDDANMLSVLQDSLAEEEYRVDTSSNGLDAINKCRTQAYDLVISDIIMPGATGLEVLSAVKEMNPGTLVILITGFASLETAVSAIREGAHDYITKPFRLEEIKIVVKNALGNIRLRRENQRLMLELEEAYRQLHLIKKIMASEYSTNSDNPPENRSDTTRKTVIAGTTIPHLLLENHDGGERTFISDLERLSRLKMEGTLSEKEFELCKSRLFKNRK